MEIHHEKPPIYTSPLTVVDEMYWDFLNRGASQQGYYLKWPLDGCYRRLYRFLTQDSDEQGVLCELIMDRFRVWFPIKRVEFEGNWIRIYADYSHPLAPSAD